MSQQQINFTPTTITLLRETSTDILVSLTAVLTEIYVYV